VRARRGDRHLRRRVGSVEPAAPPRKALGDAFGAKLYAMADVSLRNPGP